MDSKQPKISTVEGEREFVCSAVAVSAFIINELEETLLLAQPGQNAGWQVVNGAMEAGETILEAVLRETREEVGPDLRVRPLGTIHISSFHYDQEVQYMLSVDYLLAYEGGKVQPGDDMEGSDYAWWSLAEIEGPELQLLIPPGEKWLMSRAVQLYRLWKNEDLSSLPGFNMSVRGKTD